MNDPHNPYSPPREACSDETVLGNPRRRNVLLEIVRAFTTIIGIFIGWICIGAGLLNETYVVILLGCVIIGLACMVSRWTFSRWTCPSDSSQRRPSDLSRK